MHRLSTLALSLALSLLPATTLAGSFTDVPDSHQAATAIEELKTRGIIAGYPDGTFRPDEKVNRAAAVKMIVAGLSTEAERASVTVPSYGDVPADIWFAPFVAWANVKLGIIDGPDKRPNFEPNRSVTKAEFLKIFLLAQKANPAGAYAEITLPLAEDVQKSDEWFYPYFRYALSAAMTSVTKEGTLNPGQELSRAQVALLMHRYLSYKEKGNLQSLLSLANTEIGNVKHMMDQKQPDQAWFASVRGMIFARGALAVRADEPLVKAAVKATEAYNLLMSGWRAGLKGDYAKAEADAKAAWALGDKVREFSSTLEQMATDIQSSASTLASDARKQLGGA